jgi:hypothetical protein
VPEYAYIIMSGLCRVYKRVNHCEIIERELTLLREKAERFDLKYKFHHRMRGIKPRGVRADHLDPLELKAGSAVSPDRTPSKVRANHALRGCILYMYVCIYTCPHMSTHAHPCPHMSAYIRRSRSAGCRL